jgi:limonene-1,2-epoxide hydrolase
MTMPINASTASDSTSQPSAQGVVEAFVSALGRLDYDAAVALAAEDIRWVNYPLTTSRNKTQFDKALRAMFRNATRFEVQYRDIHERGDGVVYTDRIDIFEGGGVSMTLPVQGEFRVRDGRVVEWVDRFSWATLLVQIGRSLPAILKHQLGR